MDLYMDVDVALTEVPVNLVPLLDDTDFKTIEDAVAYNAAGLSLVWHFITTAGVYNNGVAVTPTTGGVHDWTDHGTHGIYTIEVPASGGTINNDTEGFGWFTGKATGVAPWRGPVICFRAAALNNLFINDGNLLEDFFRFLVRADAAIKADAAAALARLNLNRGSGAGGFDNEAPPTAALTPDYDTYHAVLKFHRDVNSSQDEYTLFWTKNAVPLSTGITSPTIQVTKRVDDTNLIAETAMSQIGSSGWYKYDATGAALTTPGEAALVTVRATIDGEERESRDIIGRDS